MRIQNLTERLIILPPIGALPEQRLLPGETTIPDEYVHAIEHPAEKQPDHRRIWGEYQGESQVDRHGNEVEYPAQLRIMSGKEKKVDLDPPTLADKSLEIALTYANETDNPKSLNRWKKDARPEVVSACNSRLVELRK